MASKTKHRRADGEGTIYFDKKSGKWKGQLIIGYNENGKVRKKKVTGETKADVAALLNQIKYEIKTGTFMDISEITIYQLALQMLRNDLDNGTVKEVSYLRNLETLKRLAPIYNTPLQSANQTQLETFLNGQRGYSQSVINKVYMMLNKTFKEAIHRDIIRKNPLERCKKPRSSQKSVKVRALTPDENVKLFNVLIKNPVPYKDQMLLSMLTGMRMGEINALQVKDYSNRFKSLSINKTITRGSKGEAILQDETKTNAGTRTLTTPDTVMLILDNVVKGKAPDEMMFLKNGKYITTSQVYNQFLRTCKKYDIIDDTIPGKVDLHSLRHTYATRCIESGMPMKALQSVLGHTDIKVTMNTYADAFEQYQSKAIGIANEYMNSLGMILEA